ncbi:MAG: DnaJ domain-containing protein [Cyanobium sp.]
MSRFSSRDPQGVAGTDHWQILGLAPGADASELKRAFRQQARRWHPDLNGNDPVAEERFKQVNEAYAVLSDPQRRRSWEQGEEPGGEPPDPFASGFPTFEDYLAELDGTASRRAHSDGRQAGEERRTPSGREEARGAAQAPGSGVDDGGREAWEGRTAEARGWVAAAPPSPPPVQAGGDQESLVELTPEQALLGERVELELTDGTVVEVRTPPLAGDGWRLRLAGVAPGGADHFLQLRVRTPEGLRIDGLRVLYPLDLSPAEAVLGAHVVVPTLDGPVRLRVPPGSSSGRLLRLRGRGQRLAERRGDQLVEVRIAVDEHPEDDALALYQRLLELEQLRGGDSDDG